MTLINAIVRSNEFIADHLPLTNRLFRWFYEAAKFSPAQTPLLLATFDQDRDRRLS